MTVSRLSVTSTETFLPGMFPNRFAWPPDLAIPRSATRSRSAPVRSTVFDAENPPGNGWPGPSESLSPATSPLDRPQPLASVFHSSGIDDVVRACSSDSRNSMPTFPSAPPSNESLKTTSAASEPPRAMLREPSDAPRSAVAVGAGSGRSRSVTGSLYWTSPALRRNQRFVITLGWRFTCRVRSARIVAARFADLRAGDVAGSAQAASRTIPSVARR